MNAYDYEYKTKLYEIMPRHAIDTIYRFVQGLEQWEIGCLRRFICDRAQLFLCMNSNHTEDKMKQLIHDAIWNELPDGKDCESLEADEIRILGTDKGRTDALVQNRLLDHFKYKYWIDTEVDGIEVMFKILEDDGIGHDRVLFRIQ